jgi:hypothetical protein
MLLLSMYLEEIPATQLVGPWELSRDRDVHPALRNRLRNLATLLDRKTR